MPLPRPRAPRSPAPPPSFGVPSTIAAIGPSWPSASLPCLDPPAASAEARGAALAIHLALDHCYRSPAHHPGGPIHVAGDNPVISRYCASQARRDSADVHAILDGPLSLAAASGRRFEWFCFCLAPSILRPMTPPHRPPPTPLALPAAASLLLHIGRSDSLHLHVIGLVAFLAQARSCHSRVLFRVLSAPVSAPLSLCSSLSLLSSFVRPLFLAFSWRLISSSRCCSALVRILLPLSSFSASSLLSAFCCLLLSHLSTG